MRTRTNWWEAVGPGVVELGAQSLGAQRGIDIGGQEIDLAALFVSLAIGHDQLDALDVLLLHAARRGIWQGRFHAEAEAHPDRVGLVNRGEQAVGGRYQVAIRFDGPAGGAGNRGLTVVHDKFSSAWRKAAWAMALAETASS